MKIYFFFVNSTKIKSKNGTFLNQNILTFNKLVPLQNPQDLNECKNNWGTKDDANIIDWETDFNEEYDSYFYKFTTNGNPPHLWLKVVAERFNNLEFNLTYQNNKRNMQGEVVYQNGILINSTHTDLENDIWNYISEDLCIDLVKKVNSIIKATSISQTLRDLKNEESLIYKNIKHFIENYDENGIHIIKKSIKFIINHVNKNIANEIESFDYNDYDEQNMVYQSEDIEFTDDEEIYE